MLHDYISPDQKHVACPNQDVVYGAGILHSTLGPSVIQVPDFQDRFWIYQGVDQRTESFLRLGAMYDTEPGVYLLALAGWSGDFPPGIEEVFTFDTAVAIVLPRVFLDDNATDRAAIQPLLNQITMYSLTACTGERKTQDWSTLPTFTGSSGSNAGDQETQFVIPEQFFAELPAILGEVPPRPGEEALHAWFASLTTAAAESEHIANLLRQSAVDADDTLVDELFQFRNIGVPSAHHWTTQRNGAAFDTDYLSRTDMDKANIEVASAQLVSGHRRADRCAAVSCWAAAITVVREGTILALTGGATQYQPIGRSVIGSHTRWPDSRTRIPASSSVAGVAARALLPSGGPTRKTHSRWAR